MYKYYMIKRLLYAATSMPVIAALALGWLLGKGYVTVEMIGQFVTNFLAM